jgi:glycosyltransferase involved in cell wall biosynthesis
MTGVAVAPGAPDAAARPAVARRVLALIDTAIVSGPGRQLAALARALGEHGVELRVVLFQRDGRPENPYAAYLARAGVSHVVLRDRGRFDLGLVPALRRLVDEWRPDVVQTHSYRTTALAWLLRRGGTRFPWVAFFHGATTEDAKVRVYNWIDARLMPAADQIVVMTRAHRARIACPPDRMRVLYNAVIPLPAEGAPVDVSDARVPGAPLVGVVGRLSSEKGVDVFLAACARLVGEGTAITAVIAGDGPERAALEAQARALGLAERVRFLGAVRDVASLYPQLDLVVLPSRSEGLPNVLLEGLRADRAVVSTAVGGVPEVLGDEPLAGVMVPSEDAPALAEGMRRALALAADPAARDARARVAARFSLTHRVAEHLRLYADVAPAAFAAPGAPGRDGRA